MPIFELNGKKYNVQDQHIADFASEYPDATTIEERDGKKYRVKSSDYQSFQSEIGATQPEVQAPYALGATPVEKPKKKGLPEQEYIQEDELQANREAFEKEQYQGLSWKDKAILRVMGKNARQMGVNADPAREILTLDKQKGVGLTDLEERKNVMQAQRNQVSTMRDEIDQILIDTQDEDQFAGIPMAGPMGATMSGMRASTRQNDERRDYMAAKRSLTDAANIIEEADRHAADGTYGGWYETSFAGGAARGFGDKLFDARTWSFGVADKVDNDRLNQALEDFDNGKELTKSQQALLDAKAVEMATQAYFGSYLGRGYKAGQVTAEAIPFMVEMAINPASAIGKSAGSMMARYALKRFGKGAATKALSRGARVAGDIAGAATMSATTGLGRVAADAAERMAGDIHYDIDQDNQTVFAGHTKGEDPATAYRKAFGATTIENYSEMFGNYFSPVLGGAGKMLRKGAESLGAGKVVKMLDDVAASDLAKVVSDFEKNAQWSGTLSEYAEEVTGGIMNAIFVGDQTLDTDEQTGVFNLDNNINTLLGVALLGGAMSTIKTAGYPIHKYQADKRIVMAETDAVSAFGNAEKWAEVKSKLNLEDAVERGKALRDVLADKNLTEEQKVVAFKYVEALQNRDGVRIGEMKHYTDETVPQEQKEIEQSFDNGYTLTTPEEKQDANSNLAYWADKLRVDFQMNEDADPEDLFEGYENPLDALKDEKFANEDVYNDALQYIYAKATMDGAVQNVRDQIDARIAENNARIDGVKNETDNTLMPATLKQGDRQVFIVRGNIAQLDDGSIDGEKSDGHIFIVDAQTLKPEMIAPSAILSLGAIENADTAKETQATQIAELMATEASAQMDGTLGFVQGDTYNILGEDGIQHTAQVVADNGDGSVQIVVDGAQEATTLPKEQVQAMSDAYHKARAIAYNEQKKAEEVAEQEAQVAEEAPQSAIEQIPTNENGEQVFEQAPAETTWAALIEMNEGDVAEAADTAQQMLEVSQKELEKATKEKAGVGTSVAEIQKIKAERKAKIDALQGRVNYWSNVLSLNTPTQEVEQTEEVAEPIEEIAEEPIVKEEETPIVEEEIAPIIEEAQVAEPIVEAEEVVEPIVEQSRPKVKNISKKEDARRQPLRERVAEWVDKLGVPVVVMETFSDIENADAKREIRKGGRIAGWYEPSTGAVMLYMPHLTDMTEIDKTITHEIVAHKGLAHMLGKNKHNALLDRVWDMMSEEAKAKYINYPNVNGNTRRAADEYIAFLSEGVNLTELDQSAWDKIVGFVRELLAEVGINMQLTDADIADLIRLSYTNLVRENQKAKETKGADDINEQEGQALFSIRTYEESGRENLQKFLKGQVKKKRITKADAEAIEATMEQMYETAVEYKDKFAPFGAWSEAEVVKGKDGQPVFSVVKKNGEYTMNLDFSTVCKKRRTLDAVFSEMIDRGLIDMIPMVGEQIAEINNIIRDYGFETACALCFVDAKRFRVAQVADKFCEMWNPMTKMSEEELQGVINEYGKKVVRGKIAKHLIEHPEDRVELGRENFIESNGFEQMEINHPEILSLYKQAQGTSLAKIPFGDVQYLNEIEGNSWTPEAAYAVGGVRLQSFSDYVPRMFFDYMQMTAGLASKKLPVHAYTKEPLFAKQFGLTGMKINLSLVPKVVEGGVAAGLDADGNYAWMEGETFPFEEAMALQNAEGYRENCGTIAVGVSDEHIEKMLDDPNIRMIIPYHKSGLNPLVAKKNRIAEFTDYTNVQNTRSANGTKLEKEDLKDMPDFNSLMHDEGMDARQAAQAYLDWCDSKGFIPKFNKFRGHQNYYKLLEDFTTIVPNAEGVETTYPQREVTMTFPTEESAFGSIESLIREGLEEDAILEGKRDEKLGEIVDTIEKEMVRFRFIGQQGAANLDKAEEATTRLDDLAVARQMESDGKDAKTIKMATGWERGADDKWRYEVNDDITSKHIRGMKGAGLKKIQEARSARLNALDKFAYIVQVVGVDRLYNDEKILATSWPETQKQNWLNAYDMYKDNRDEAIEDVRKARAEIRRLSELGKGEFMLYEVLGETHNLFKEYPQLRNVKVILKPYKGGNDRGNYNRLTNTITIIDYRGIMENDKGEGSANTLVHEIQHIIQGIEGFARGGNTLMDDPNKVKAKKEEIAYHSELYGESLNERDALMEQARTLNEQMQTWWENNPDATWEEALADKEMFELNKKYSDVQEELEEVRKRSETYVRALESAEDIDTSLGLQGYKRVAGEVEARNVERRRNMSMGERLASLASETEDVARKDQIFIFNALADANQKAHFRVAPEMDAQYLSLVEDGNLEEAQKMVDAAANAAGYNADESWKKAHRAPRKSEDNVNPFNTEELVPADYWAHPEWYTQIRHYQTDRESYYNMLPAINKYKRLVAEGKQDEADKVTVTMYRGVDKRANKKESTFRNGDWITPSRSYALLSAPEGNARVISQDVLLKDIWWDGNSINEWGYDDGANYVYADTKNNRKSADAVTYDDNGNVIPLSKRFNKRSEDVRFRVVEPAPTFYSNAANAVLGIKQEKATPEQWLKMIEKAGGLKAGEDKWIGLSDWLKASDKKTLTKQEVLDYINENQIQIEEVKYSEFGAGLIDQATEKLDAEMREIGIDAMREKYPDFDNYFELFDGELVWSENNASEWEYEDYIIDNHILDVDPTQEGINETRLGYTTDGLDNKREIALTVPTIEPWKEGDQIHFGDAGDGRAIAWIRFGETVDEYGFRVLVIDEIQSKRHQEGREKGYRPSDVEKYLKDNNVEVVETGEFYEFYRDGELDRRFSKGLLHYKVDEAKKLYVAGYNKSDIPEAPFEKNWAELAMKRMLRYAAENGYDAIAWTKGDQQAERYNIGSKVERIISYTEDGAKAVRIYLSNNEPLNLRVDSEGKVISANRVLDGENLSDVVGKDVALKILRNEGEDATIYAGKGKEYAAKQLSGDGLRIGGEGMKAFYDQILPSFMNKYGKKWGVKVQDVTLPFIEEAGRTMHSVDVTDSMRESVMQGQPMFRVADSKKPFKELEKRYKRLDKSNTEALNAWRDEKAATIQSVITAISDELGFEPPIMVFNGGKDIQEVVDHIVDAYKEMANLDVDKEWVKTYIEESKAIGLYWPDAGVITSDVSNYDNTNDVLQASSMLMHENTHHLVNSQFDNQDFEAIWDEAVNAGHPLVNHIEKKYKNVANGEKGNEVLAYAIGNIAKNTRENLFNYVKGEPISEENLLEKAEYSLPLGKFALSEILNTYKNDLRRSKEEVGGSNREANRGDHRVGRLLRDRTGIRRKAVKEAAELFAKQLNTPIRIVEDVNTITDNNAKLQERKRNAKGWFDNKANEVVVVLTNATSVEDVRETIFHEVVGHKGLRELVGKERYDAFLEKVYRGASETIRERIARRAAKLGWDFNLATDEYLADLAEEGFEDRENRNFFEVVRDLFLDMLSEAKIALGYNISDNDMRYMLWRTYQMQRSKGALAIAEDMVMQQKLGVGNFAPSNTQFRVAEGEYLKAPNGKDTNLTPEQWEMVRTKEFKNWFGDWEKPYRIEKLRRTKSVSISGNEIEASDDMKVYRKNALEYGKSLRGEYLNADTNNTIIINRDSITEVLHHDGNNVAHIQSIAAIPQLIENGIYITSEPVSQVSSERLKNAKEVQYYVCGLNIGGVPYTVKFVVAEFENGERYYDHALTQIEKGDLLNRAELSSTVADSKSPISDIKDKRLVLILQTNSSKVLDANGEPLVVWHGGEFATDEFVANGSMHFGTKTAALQRILDNAWGYGNWEVTKNEDGTWGWSYTDPDDSGYDKRSEGSFARPLDAMEDAVNTAAPNAVVRPYFLNIRDLERTMDQNTDWEDVISESKEDGHDGIVYRNDFEDDGEDSYIAFSPEQIKLADGSNTTFDPTDDDIRFRAVSPSKISNKGIMQGIRNEYDKLVKTSAYQSREASQDSMLSLRRFMEMTAKAYEIPMDAIKDWENAYQSENALSSKNEAQIEEFDRLYGAPLIQTVQELRKKGYTYEQIDDYLQIKHGIERNREMAVRAAISDEEGKIDKEKLEKWNAAKERVSNDQSLDSWEKEQRELDRIAKEEFEAEFDRDYSGLTAMYPDEKKIEDAVEKGYAKVNDFEKNVGQNLINELWRRIRAANMQTLNKAYRTGLISKETFDSISNMYSYYVPLRGFAETTSDEVYGYLNNEPMAFNAPIRKARGRSSKADQVLPNVLSAAHSAILQGNRNTMKNHFLNFVQHYPTDLISVQNMWVEYDKATKQWVAKFPELEDTDSPEEVATKTQAFEEKMKELKEKYPKQYKQVTQKIDVPYIVQKQYLKQHQIVVKRNGVDVVLTVNGSPRLAIAMNGTQPTTTLLGKAKDWASTVTRYLSGMYTSYNPDFVVSNFIRDAIYTMATVWLKESPAYAARFNKNKNTTCNPVNMGRLILKYSAGTLDMNNEVEKAFYDFVMNGGETGYAKLASIEQLKKDIGHMIEPTMFDNVKALGKKLAFINRSAESSARFAAFLTSRQMGRSVARSVADAKEISVNFNKKGAGDLFMDAKDQTWVGKMVAGSMGWTMPMYAFFNAGMQGLNNFLRIYKHAPLKTTALTTGLFLLGTLIASMLEGDDEEEYYALPESVRRQNIVFRAGDNAWVKIPLPIEMRAIYGLGEMFTSITKGKENLSEHGIAYKMAEQLSQVLPINVLEGKGGLGTLVPTFVAPIAEVMANEDWAGLPIYREDIYKGDSDIPEYLRVYARTGEGYVAASEFLNDITGGDNRERGAIQINPAVIEHLVDGYLGGPAQFMNKVVSSAEMAFGDKEFDLRAVPFVNRVLMSDNTTMSKKTVNNYYYRHKEEAERIDRLVKNYQKDMNDPTKTDEERAYAAEKAQEKRDSEEWRKAQEFLRRTSAVEDIEKQLKEAPEGTSDEVVYKVKDFANEVYKKAEK